MNAKPNCPVLSGHSIRLRPLRAKDAPIIQQRFPKWEVVKYLTSTVPWPYPSDGAAHYVEQIALPAMKAREGYYWSILSASWSEELIGVICLLPSEPDNQRGFWLDPEFWGQGITSKAADLVTQFAFTELGMDQLILGNAEPNIPSIRIKQKQGAHHVRTEPGIFVSGPLPKQVWHLRKEHWRRL